MLATDVGAKNVHIIAYSMGARTLLEAMRQLDREDLGEDLGVKTHLYFMAPDASASVFSQVAKNFKFPSEKSPNSSQKPLKIEVEMPDNEKTDKIEQETEKEAEIEGGICRDHPFEGITGGNEGVLSRGSVGEDWGVGFSAIVEQLADVSATWIEDAVLALRNSGKVWREGRAIGWGEFLHSVFEEGGNGVKTGVEIGENVKKLGGREGSFVHLYAAENDVALLLSELMDKGPPKLRAGRRTKEFLLCNDTFSTIDASALKTGLLTTGHFYLFHRIVRADMRHVLEGKEESPWWRKPEKWRRFHYWKLRESQPKSWENTPSMSEDQWTFSGEPPKVCSTSFMFPKLCFNFIFPRLWIH